MTFIEFLNFHVCYRRLIDEMPPIGSSVQKTLLRLYERGLLSYSHPYARQMRKLEYLTRSFRCFYEQGCDCTYVMSCCNCIENGGF